MNWTNLAAADYSLQSLMAAPEFAQTLTQVEFSLIALVSPISLVLAGLWAGSARANPSSIAPAAAAVGFAGALGPLIALALAFGVALRGPMVSPLIGQAGLGASLRFDALSVLIFAMVSLLSLVILRFSRSYMDRDPRQGVFLSRMAFTIAAVEVLVLSGNLALFVVAWVATSASLQTLLLFRPERPAAVAAARKKFIAARIGDACLLGAAVLIYQRFGTGELGAILAGAYDSSGLQLEAAAALLAVAALFKSAQFPTHGWLVEVMETPTPVSALLHAGILNAGPFLMMRFAGLMEAGAVSAVFLVVGGGFTALFASVVLLTQPSVKVALGYSSAAHMGFMLLVCGLGVYPAAVLHLVAHSFYKAHAFLSSGSVVDAARADGVPVPERLRSPLRMLTSLVFAAALYLGLAALIGLELKEEPALIAVGAILVLGLTQLLAPALDARGSVGGVAGTIGIAVMTTLAFFGLEAGASHMLARVIPAIAEPGPIVIALTSLTLVAFAAAVGLQIVGLSDTSRFRHRAYVLLRNGLYANAMLDRMVGTYRR